MAVLAEGAVIDNMDDAALWDQKTTDGTATLTVSSVTGYAGKALEGAYDFKTGNYVVFGRKFATIDLSAGDALTFFYKGTGSKNSIEVKIQDSGGDWFIKVLTDVSDTPDWTRAVLKLKTDFTFAFMEGTSGDSKLATSAIKKISIGVTKSAGGTGTLLVDDMSGYQSTADTVVVDIDNHDDGATPNILGGSTAGTYIDGAATVTTTYDNRAADQPDTGTFSLRLDFVKTATIFSAAWVEVLGNFLDLSSCTELIFDIRGAVGGEALAVGLRSVSSEYLVSLSSYLTSGVTTSWQKARIPLSAFSGIDKSALANMTIWFQATSAGSNAYSLTANGDTRTIWIDNIRGFKAPYTTPVLLQMVDSFESPVSVSGWSTSTGGDATLNIDRATGKTGKAFQLTYAFNSGTYAIMERKVTFNVLQGSAFEFLVKGTGGGNNLEFKVKDGDGTTFYKVLNKVTNTSGAWTTINVPYTELSFVSSGTDDYLNLGDIAEVDYAATKVAGQTTSGTVDIDGLSYVSASSLNATQSQSSGVIEGLAVKSNPVSPNGDGIDDEVTFQYTLRESSVVTLGIYDLQGRLVRQVFGGAQAAGSQSMSWDVYDRAGRLCRNGLCVFRLEAKSTIGSGVSDIRNLIAVVR